MSLMGAPPQHMWTGSPNYHCVHLHVSYSVGWAWFDGISWSLIFVGRLLSSCLSMIRACDARSLYLNLNDHLSPRASVFDGRIFCCFFGYLVRFKVEGIWWLGIYPLRHLSILCEIFVDDFWQLDIAWPFRGSKTQQICPIRYQQYW